MGTLETIAACRLRWFGELGGGGGERIEVSDITPDKRDHPLPEQKGTKESVRDGEKKCQFPGSRRNRRGPPLRGEEATREGTHFLAKNNGRRSLCVDKKQPEGLQFLG
jgi:hypothetical protein